MKQLIVILGALFAFAACTSTDEERRAVGELASERIELTVEVNEPIVEITVAEGDAVTVGQILLRQDDTRAKSRLAAAIAAHLQTRARLDELIRGPRSEQVIAARANVEGATQDLDFRQSDLERVTEIHELGLASPDALDKSNAALDGAQATLKLRLAQLEELLAGTTVEELAQAEQAVKQAAALRDIAVVDVDRHNLRSPVNGILDSRLFETGERPGVGQPAVIVLGDKQPYARVYVPEDIRVQIKPGMKALIFVDGMNAPVGGRVRWIASEAAFTPYFALTERDRGRLSYVAKIDITDIRERLPDGVPVEVEFLLDDDF